MPKLGAFVWSSSTCVEPDLVIVRVIGLPPRVLEDGLLCGAPDPSSQKFQCCLELGIFLIVERVMEHTQSSN